MAARSGWSALGALLTIVGLAVFVWSLAGIAARLHESGGGEPRPRWAMQRVELTEFEHQGVPFGAVWDDENGLRITWGRTDVFLPSSAPTIEGMPNLRAYETWFYAAHVRRDMDGAEGTVDGDDVKMVAVARRPADGLEGTGWGDARYKDWLYTFLEFLPNGTVDRAEIAYRDFANDIDSWRFVVAMHVTPKQYTPAAKSASALSYPNYKGVRTAIGVMGWRWPAAGVSAVVVVGGAGMFAAGKVRRPS